MRCATFAIVLALSATGCTKASAPPAKQEVVWQALGSWSGRGNMQTESLTTDSGALRVRWQTRNDVAGGTSPFRLAVQSAISGRLMATAVDMKGNGNGTAYLGEDPHVFYMLIESANLDWSFTVEEGLTGRVTERH
jgi:hypothetical protein